MSENLCISNDFVQSLMRSNHLLDILESFPNICRVVLLVCIRVQYSRLSSLLKSLPDWTIMFVYHNVQTVTPEYSVCFCF